ncbi:MAG TPA: restriction endonuclease subunit S [Flavisolibacter sp.]|nr:restriction endonuclease subunit S [Flavisolibacter sp.]
MKEEQKINGLPKDWKWVKLHEIVSLLGDGLHGTPVYSEDGDYYFINGNNLSDGKIIIKENTKKVCQKQFDRHKKNLTDKTILVSINGTIGNVAFYKNEKVILGKSACYFNVKEDIDKYYIALLLKGERFLRYANSSATGSTIKNVSLKAMREFELPLPPKETQQQIVSKIEELFSELDKGIEELKTTQQQLKVYRQAVLKWAFEGKLTNEDVKDGELPEGWQLQRLDDIGTWRGGGTPSKGNKEFWENGNILWVSPKDMKSKVITDTIDKITGEAIEMSTAQLIPKGSVLFVVRSGILRRTLPVATTICDVTVNQDLKALTPRAANPDYVFYYVEAKNDDIRKTCSKDGTTVESIETALLKNYQIPICSSEEQQQIVQEIESRLSICDKIEETITNSLKQAEALRQSILKKAFKGTLL